LRSILGLVLTVGALAVLFALSPGVPSTTRGRRVVNRLSLESTAAAKPQQHKIQTLFIILMENHNWTGRARNANIKGKKYAPSINKTLLPMASHAEQYFNPPGIHPSLPNYLWLEAGTNFGILDDNPPSIDHQSTTQHLVALLNNAGITWKAYQENISGTVCPLTDSYPYAVRHDPFVYFDDDTDNLNPNSAYCISHVRPYTELASDLMANSVASYNFITPNVCDDMHDKCKGNPLGIRHTLTSASNS